MFDIRQATKGVVSISGKFTAAEADQARELLAAVDGPVTLDLSELGYISSVGLGVLLKLHKRLTTAGSTLTFTGLNRNISELFHVAGFDLIFDIEEDSGK